MQEKIKSLIERSEIALTEIKTKAVPVLSIEIATSWVNKHIELEEDSIIFHFISENSNDFSFVFNDLESIVKLTPKRNEIIKCSHDFKKINTKNYDEVLNFLTTYNEILSKYRLPDLHEVDEKYYALSKFDYLKFKKEDIEIFSLARK